MCACLTSFSVSNDLLLLRLITTSFFSLSLCLSFLTRLLIPFFLSVSRFPATVLASMRKEHLLLLPLLLPRPFEIEASNRLSGKRFSFDFLLIMRWHLCVFVRRTSSKEIRHFMTICYLSDRCKRAPYISRITDLEFLFIAEKQHHGSVISGR